MSSETAKEKLLERLAAVVDKPAGRYEELNGATTFAGYLSRDRDREDEELLTEPILADLLEQVLGFPPDAYFPQLGRSGRKPDFTPIDLVAHSFVLDAKSSKQDLEPHERQIRSYIDQRQLDYGVLFNLREVRVYARGAKGHDTDLSFRLLPLWQAASGEALPDDAEVDRLARFAERFSHRKLSVEGKIKRIQSGRSWAEREERGEDVRIDLDFLVDRLRALSRTFADDAAAQHETLVNRLSVNPGRERSLLRELELIAIDLAPGTEPSDLPEGIDGYRDADGLPARVWKQYLLRVSQLALTRILLYRSWEDVEFVESCLHDGGFVRVYERVGESLRDVLRQAFSNGLERYRWLYGADNNYDWYRPREEPLAEALYTLVPVPLGKLDADVLGGLYESYVDNIDRDRLGQFYTPRAVVRFMLDRAGFSGPDGVFQIEGDQRRERRILDFATGSGGFLVEAARRVLDDGGIDTEDGRDLTEALAAIVRGFHGCEISPFPYYLTEVNLLLQVSRLLGMMRVAGAEPPPFALGVVHADMLTARAGPDESIEGMEAESRLDRAELVEDERFGLVPLDAEKRESFNRMRADEAFDLVVGNPPYVFESGNKLLFDRLRALPGWKSVYRGKSDYLCYFLQLAAEKVAPGGRLCVITPAGWMNAGNADWLREKIAGTLRLDELYLFGSYRLFAPERGDDRGMRAPTPTVESAILLATKADVVPDDHELRVIALENEAEAAVSLSGDRDERFPDRDTLLEEMASRGAGESGRAGGILVHDLRQAELTAGAPWPIKHAAEDVAARVVTHLQGQLDDSELPVEALEERWTISRGIETAADAYTARIQRRLSLETKKRLEVEGSNTGDPILELPAGAERVAPWRDHPEVLARSIEPGAILYGAVDEEDYTSLVWLGRDDDPPESVIAALERWRPVLATRAGFKDSPERRWFETHRTRNKEKLQEPKVIALYRTDRGRFAFDEKGEWQPSNKSTLCVGAQPGLSVAYLCGLLNSELVDLWYAVRGKNPRDVWRNYEPKPMAKIPYRHVAGVGGLDDPNRSDELEELAEAVERRDWRAAEEASAAIGAALESAGSEAEAAAAVEALVRWLAGNRRELLPHREVFPELRRTVKDPWRIDPGEVDDRAAVAMLPGPDLVSIRLHPELSLRPRPRGAPGRRKSRTARSCSGTPGGLPLASRARRSSSPWSRGSLRARPA
ncbi:MAG: N-6 DNA methylase [Thermoleophilaceae bacterium]